MNTPLEQTVYSPFFKLRRASRFAIFDTAGYWSYPAFLADRGGDLYWLHLVAPTAKSRSGAGHALFKPKALVVTVPNSKVIVRYENYRAGHDPSPALPWDKPLALLVHPSVASMPRPEWAERERSLLRDCEEAGKMFVKTAQLPEAFRSEYLTLQNPFFLPWLGQLCPAFVNALKIQENPSRG